MIVARIGVLGGGSWGTALAHLAARAGQAPVLWARNREVVAALNSSHRHPRFLVGIDLDPAINATADLGEACHSDVVLLVVPAQAVRDIANRMVALLPPGVPVICCSKGLEIESGALLSEILRARLPEHPIGCLSGPTFAAEAVAGMPTAVTLAFDDTALASGLAQDLGSATFRPYVSNDVIGTEVAGAIKNVLAIACGIASGQGFGENTRAALITRGLAEAIRFAVALGGQPKTLAGLSGIGDLAMSCASRQSRNFRFGEALGAGAAISAALADSGGVVEGHYSAAPVLARAEALSVELPICSAVNAILNCGVAVQDVIDGLMHRPLRNEQEY